jgi:hypothetical protein
MKSSFNTTVVMNWISRIFEQRDPACDTVPAFIFLSVSDFTLALSDLRYALSARHIVSQQIKFIQIDAARAAALLLDARLLWPQITGREWKIGSVALSGKPLMLHAAYLAYRRVEAP